MNEPDVSKPALRAFLRLVKVAPALIEAVARDLKAAGFPPPAHFTILRALARSDTGRMRPGDLQTQTLMAQYNLSRLLDRLEEAGSITREKHADDARGQWVVLTDAGRAVHKSMWPIYAQVIERHVGSKLSVRRAERLGNYLARLTRDPGQG